MKRLLLAAACALVAASPAVSAPRQSRLLGTKDGGPRYEVPAQAKDGAARTGLFAVDLDTLFPAGSREQSPKFEGGGDYFTPAYLVEFWRQYPNALNPSGLPAETAPGQLQPRPIFLTGLPKDRAAIPAAEQARLSAQAEHALDLILKNAWMGTPHGHEIRYTKKYVVERDAAGNVAYGFELDVKAWPLVTQDKDGRWRGGSGEASSLTVYSNSFSMLNGARGVAGRLRGVQYLNVLYGQPVSPVYPAQGVRLFAADSAAGSGQPAVRPDLFADGRPKSDVRFLLVRIRMGKMTDSALNQGRLSPMDADGKLVGAAYLTPWSEFPAWANGPARGTART